jgi:hypothetical protein
MKKHFVLIILFIVFAIGCQRNKVKDEMPDIIVSTDIGGSDPDDFQSMVHLLIYADTLKIKGLISSPPHEGSIKDIEEAITAYESDYPKLNKLSENYPTPDYLRSVTKQGAFAIQQDSIPQELSEGAAWIIEKAKASKKPLYVLVWGSITDVAQAVHHDPLIKNTLRVYSIGSWNTRMDPKSRDYLYDNHPDLWWIESNTTFRGMYMGGYREGDYGNLSFVEKHVKGHGALGDLFYSKKKDIKMGDTPSVLYFLNGDHNNPETDSWGGAYVRTSHGANYWNDNQDENLIEQDKAGAKTVNNHRKDYLDDWANRMKYLKN